MLSRVADSLYWMSRYLERAEHTARVMEVQYNLMLEVSPESEGHRWLRVVRSLGVKDATLDENSARALAHSLATDPSSRASIVHGIMSARENARQVREQISSEMWQQLNRLFLEVRRAGIEDLWEQGPVDFLQAIREGSHMFQGITDSTMAHSEGWHFIQVGRFIERACLLSTLIDVHFQEFHSDSDPSLETGDHLEWVGLLKSCTAFEAYCKVFAADTRPDRIAEFLILSPSFPHAIRFSVESIESALKDIGAQSTSRRGSRVERIAGRLRASLGFGQIDEIFASGLHAALRSILEQCAEIHSALHQVYITYPIDAALKA
jgi:uncharacterized alpha-E superfamily protein